MVATRQSDRDAMVHCIQILAIQETDSIALVIAQATTLTSMRFMGLSDQMIRIFTYKEDPEEATAVSKTLQDSEVI